jgi:hypothetical protein
VVRLSRWHSRAYGLDAMVPSPDHRGQSLSPDVAWQILLSGGINDC